MLRCINPDPVVSYRGEDLGRLAEDVPLLLTSQRTQHMFKFLLIVVKRYTAALID